MDGEGVEPDAYVIPAELAKAIYQVLAQLPYAQVKDLCLGLSAMESHPKDET